MNNEELERRRKLMNNVERICGAGVWDHVHNPDCYESTALCTVLVTGGRDNNDREFIYEALDDLHARLGIGHVVQGGAKGVDSIACDWARSRKVGYVTHYANWKLHGNCAGPVRNAIMLERSRPDLVVTFDGGRGTDHMRRTARSSGVHVLDIYNRDAEARLN